jgi:hypothetical protein
VLNDQMLNCREVAVRKMCNDFVTKLIEGNGEPDLAPGRDRSWGHPDHLC